MGAPDSAAVGRDLLGGAAQARPRGLVARLASALAARSSPAYLALLVSLGVCTVLFLDVPAASDLFSGVLVTVVHRGAVLSLAGLSLVMTVTESEHTFRSAASMHTAVSLLLVIAFRQPEGSLAILLIAGLLPRAVFERFPANLGLCAGQALLYIGALLIAGNHGALFCFRLVLIAVSVGLASCLMGHYRESIISLQRYINRLEGNVSALTRANSLSQDYARDVEEESRVAERQRLSRDIHDAIGYTLTNTIMVMEAVKMMVNTEPERVGDYLETARKNTEEGLANIKRILRDFRSRDRPQESCFRAIRKLVKVFSLSTGLAVRFEFGNLDVAVLDRAGECVYHFVQEGLINAFRHGRAARVSLLFWDYGDSFRVTLDDDGGGCAEEPVAGIGMSGMRERAQLVGGRIEVDRFVAGFRISMYLPRGGSGGAAGRQHDQSAHRR